MSSAILLMLLTGVLWALVGVLFGAAPAEKDRLWSFFALNGILFTAFVWLTQAPAAAPPREVFRLAALIVPSAVAEVFAFLLLKLAMERGPQGIAWSVSQSAMALAFLGSVAFLGTPASAAQWLGLALALASLVLFARVRPAGPAGAGAGGRGVDATEGVDAAADAARALAERTGAAVLVTGLVDLVVAPGGAAPVRIANGVELLTRVTGVGCAQGALCAALCAAADGDARLAAVAAALLVGLAGERAERVSRRPGSFAVAFLDALDEIDAAAFEAEGRVLA